MRFTLVVLVLISTVSIPAVGVALHPPGSGDVQPISPLPYHNAQTLVCTDCHVIHFSSGHDAGGNPSPLLSGSPNPGMLKAGDPLDVCLSCHDSHAGAPDVVGSDANGLDDRSAGFFDEGTGFSFKGHTLGRNLAPVCDRCHGKDMSTAAVTCIDCHDPHGNGRPRNLRWASAPGAEPQFGLLVDPSITGMARYESAHVGYGTADGDSLREVTSICIDCHHGFSGSANVGQRGDHVRHPSYDSERGSTNTISSGSSSHTTSPVHWAEGSGAGFDGASRVPFITDGAATFEAARAINPAANGAFCLSCHKAHGSGQAFGMTWTGESTGCRQCHGF